MLHELLLALVGYTGDLIIDEREHQESLGVSVATDSPISEESTFKLAPDLSFIEASERDVIERLISLGFYYRELDRFASKSRDLSWIRSTNNTPSLPQQLVLLRGKTKNPSFFVLLPPLHELIVEIERADIRGGELLNLLHKRCHCGVPELQACFQRLLWHGHQVMYNQLASWMIYGIIQDQHGEFFIKRQEDMITGSEESPSENFGKSVYKSPDDASLTDWHLRFHIFLEMLPDYIHMRVAESILFAGKAVRVLRNPSPSFKCQDAVSHQPVSRGPQKVQGFTGRFAFHKEFSVDTKMVAEELLSQAEADKVDAMLKKLKDSSEFHKRSFESAVDAVRVISASHLWQLVVVRADLNGHLRALKDYFLLAKGDFFQCFLEESRQLMRLPPRQSTTEAYLVVPFQLAAIKTIGDEGKYFSRVSLRMPSSEITAASSQGGLLQRSSLDVGLAYQGTTPSELSLDGWMVFLLNTVWIGPCSCSSRKKFSPIMHQDHTDFAKRRNDRENCSISQQRRQRSRPMWHVREHMEFLIRNLQFYIQVDVIESQWNLLQAHVQDSHDFTELVGFHQEYLCALISQSFLDIGSVSRILDSIMKLCLQLCWSIESENSPNSSDLEHITEEFNKKSNSLYTILRSSRLAGSQRAPILRRFLLRLNFNAFFETTARGVLNVVRSRPTLPDLPQ
ncbi:hypothetical protein MKX01_001303 [Papaver californicum]|nr:hypothetical protein MKX01_001303 [Papaver californicum]